MARRRSSRTTGTTSPPHSHVGGRSAPHVGDACERRPAQPRRSQGRTLVGRSRDLARNARSTVRVAHLGSGSRPRRRPAGAHQPSGRIAAVHRDHLRSLGLDHASTGDRATGSRPAGVSNTPRRPACDRPEVGWRDPKVIVPIFTAPEPCRHVGGTRRSRATPPDRATRADSCRGPDDLRRPALTWANAVAEREWGEERFGRHERRLT